MHASFLAWRGYRWLWTAAGLCAACGLAYLVHQPLGRPNGGTWLGYGLGAVGAGLVLWLSWFGLRKRRYQSGGAPLVGWLSAHVYLGVSVVFVATLHTGFQLGANLHGLAYALLIAVVASGLVGVAAYRVLPTRLSANREDRTLDGMLALVSGYDREARHAARPLGNDVNAAVVAAADHTRIGGSAWRQLSGTEPSCATAAAVRDLERMAAGLTGDERRRAEEVLAILARKASVLAQVRRDVQIRAWLQIWLYLHVPLTFGLLGALAAHVFAVLVLR